MPRGVPKPKFRTCYICGKQDEEKNLACNVTKENPWMHMACFTKGKTWNPGVLPGKKE